MITCDRDMLARRTWDAVEASVETENLPIGVKALRSWEFGGRRDQQGPEKGNLGRVVEKRIQVQWRRIIDMSSIDHRQLFSD
jgi:hypothetical protein